MFESVTIWGIFGAQGHAVPKGLLTAGRNSNLSAILCLF